MNEKLVHRMCRLIAMNYAIKPEVVLEIYSKNNSIDKTLEIVSNIK